MTGVQQAPLVAVLAHPDDESRLVGGTLALAAARGVRAGLYCATRGEAGDTARPAAEVAQLREGELHDACRVLGIAELWLEGFPDGGLVEADPEVVVERIVAFLRTVRPEVVVTFGPDGRTGHPDHIAVGHLAGQAFDAAGDPQRFGAHRQQGLAPWQPGFLYHLALARSVATQAGWTDPSRPDEELLAIDISPVLDRKQAASVHAHASQWALSPLDLSHGWQPHSTEHFHLARSVTDSGLRDVLADLA